MSFNSAIPQPTDLISVSQGDLLNNFTSMQSTYTTDHFGFNPVTDLGFHKKVTLPGGGSVPAPASGFGDIYAVTNGSMVTNPYWVSDGLSGSVQFAMMPMRAYGVINGAGGLVNSYNISTVTNSGGPNFTYTVNLLANVVTGTSYGVLLTPYVNSLTPAVIGEYKINLATQFQVQFRNNSGTALPPDFFTVMILQV